MCPLSKYQDMSMYMGLNAKGKIDRESDKGNSYAQGLVGVYGGENVRMRLPQLLLAVTLLQKLITDAFIGLVLLPRD